SVALLLPSQLIPGENHSRSWPETRAAQTCDQVVHAVREEWSPRRLALEQRFRGDEPSSIFELTGSFVEAERLKKFYGLFRVFAERVWDKMLEALVAKEDFRRCFDADDEHREVWRSLVEEPLGRAVERYLHDDLLRGLVFTDAKVGLFTHASDETLLQN